MLRMMEGGKKLASILLSVLLASLLLPACSPMVVHAAENTPALTFSMHWFEGEEEALNTFTQKKPLEAIFASTDSKVVKPQVESFKEHADLVAAIDKEIAAKGGDKGSAAEVELEWQSFDESEGPITADDKVLTVTKDKDGSWKFVAQGSSDFSGVSVATIITKATVKATFEYAKASKGHGGASGDAGGTGGKETVTEEGSVEGVVLTDIAAKASYSVVVDDAFAADKAAIASAFGEEYAFTYGDSAAAKQASDLAYGSYTVEIASGAQDSFEVSAEASGNTVKAVVAPKHAADAQQTATLKISAKGADGNPGKSWEQEVKVSISKKELSFGDQQQAYRLRASQLSRVKDTLASEAKGQMANLDSVDAVVDLNGVAFDSYLDEEGGAVTLSGIKLGSDASASDYSLKSTSITVAVAAVQQVASDKAEGLSVTGRKGSGAGGQEVSIPQGPGAEEVWVATAPVAWRSGCKVALSLADKEGGDSLYGAFANLDATAKGTYSNQLLYSQDDDGVITKVTGISYRLDPDAPRVKSFSVAQQPKSVFSGNWFFQDKADVSVSVTDDIGADQFSQNVAQPGVSGLASEGAKISYTDDHGGESREVTDFKVDGANGVFQFALDGDQDVAAMSFEATVTDKAGNTMIANTKDALQIPDQVIRLISDSAAPELSLSFDNMDAANGKYYKASRTATITIKEAHFGYVQQYDPSQAVVKIVENGQVRCLTPDSFQTVAADTWQATVNFANNSDYEVYAQVTDLVGRSSGVKSDLFTVDTIASALSISFDNENSANGMYFNAARTATVTVIEHNFDEGLFSIAPISDGGNGGEVGSASVSGWINDGDTHIARVTFPGQGVYSLTVTGQDLASNQATAYICPEFVVDTIKPQISISVGGQVDASSHAYAEDAAIEVSVDDANVSAATTMDIQGIGLGTSADVYSQNRIDGATKIAVTAASPAQRPECDGVYRLNVSAVDLAGNTETKTVDWSVNRFGSTFVLSDDTGAMVAKRYFNSRDLSDVEVTEINPSGVSAESISVQVAKGTNNSVLAYGRDYTFASAGDRNGWPALTANGEDITLARDDLVGGDYRITLKESAIEQGIHVVAYDAAGNEANVDSANIFINSDPIARWVHNTALFVVSILIMVASLGVGGWAAYRRFAK